jgi:hypothetical protein
MALSHEQLLLDRSDLLPRDVLDVWHILDYL